MCKIKREGVPTHEAAAGSVVRPPGVSGRIPEPTVPCQLPSPCPHGSRARSVCRKLSVPVVCRASVQLLLTECLLGSREHARGRSLSHGSHLPPESLHPEEGGAKWISAPHPFIVLLEGHGGGGGRCPWAGGRAAMSGCQNRGGDRSTVRPGQLWISFSLRSRTRRKVRGVGGPWTE